MESELLPIGLSYSEEFIMNLHIFNRSKADIIKQLVSENKRLKFSINDNEN